MAMGSDDRPFEDLEEVLASIAHILIAKGRLEDAAIFAKAKIDLEYREHDNWDGGTSVWDLCVRIPLPNFSAYSDEEKKELEEFIDRVINPFLPETGHWVRTRIHPLPFKDPNWRTTVASAVAGSAITNQGRAHSKNVAPLEFDGLLFRSDAEITLYKALKATGIPFAPLPVFIRGGSKFSRVEPDFVLIKDSVVVFVEVDGKSTHKESAAEAHYRIKPFQDEGVIVERVKAEHCDTPELAQRYARHLADLIRKRTTQK